MVLVRRLVGVVTMAFLLALAYRLVRELLEQPKLDIACIARHSHVPVARDEARHTRAGASA